MSVCEKSLDEIIVLQRGHDLPVSLATGSTYPVVGSSGIIAYHNLFTCPAPCITVGRSGSGVGKVRYTNQDAWAHNTTLYVKNFKGNDPTYVYYTLLNTDLKAHSGGSAVPTLNRNHLSKIVIKYETDIALQKAKGNILLSLDMKINQVLMHIQSLEESVQVIYQNWFCDFNYPEETGEMHDGIPVDWTNSNVFDNVTEVREKNKFDNNYPVLSVVKDGVFKPSDDVFTKQVYSKITTNYKIVRRNQVGYNPARANIGSIAMLTDFEVGLVSPIYIVFKLKESVIPTFFYYYMKQPMFVEAIKHHAIGTTRQNFPFEAFKMFPMVVPPIELQERFREIANPIEQKIAKLKEENTVLTEIRDTLMPKLMSGELQVKVGEV